MPGKQSGGLPGGMGNLLRKMEQTVSAAQKAEEQMAELRFTSSAGGGMVTVSVNGKGELLDIKISPEVVNPNEVGMLEDLLTSAIRDALKQASDERSEKLTKLLPGGLNLSGLF